MSNLNDSLATLHEKLQLLLKRYVQLEKEQLQGNEDPHALRGVAVWFLLFVRGRGGRDEGKLVFGHPLVTIPGWLLLYLALLTCPDAAIWIGRAHRTNH
jgi:hypothetical protein